MTSKNNEKKCEICNTYENTLQVMNCEICDSVFHVKCIKYTEKEYRLWADKLEICFICAECKNSPQLKQYKELRRQNAVLEGYIYKIDETLQVQKGQIDSIGNGAVLVNTSLKSVIEKFDDLKNDLSKSVSEVKESVQKLVEANSVGGDQSARQPSNLTYSGVLKESSSVCVIKPKDNKQDRNVTKKSIMKEIDPVSVRVSGMRNVSDGGVAIVCDTVEALNGVREIAESKLGDLYSVSVPKTRFPRVKISGLSESLSSDDLKRMLVSQNPLPVELDTILVVAVLPTRRKIYFDAILEVPPSLYNFLLELGKVKIGWNVCHVSDGVRVRRCAKCCSYGHLAKDCKQERHTCSLCAGDHHCSQCTCATRKCINCTRANVKYGLKLCVDHAADSEECHVYCRETRILRERLSLT
ncbi:uncharacterized protein LOC129789913 [Lutzomyia longipalpis]|uniref:uncharacterized protein LOC129789913 n=1 Tax=Lutzomyia longipalpis TaxID=7200 RepID=UPI00248415C9|nr:uncharacterized protein LOC129789913 [Lutzomyia longipalpis]